VTINVTTMNVALAVAHLILVMLLIAAAVGMKSILNENKRGEAVAQVAVMYALIVAIMAIGDWYE
jgi:Na+-driven multidrug efflux pump